jgi:hypothetical protein
MEKHVVTLKAEKVTKNTIRFQEESGDSGKPPVIGQMYLPKWVVGDTDSITVTVEPTADVVVPAPRKK